MGHLPAQFCGMSDVALMRCPITDSEQDRSNIGLAKVAGMEKELNISPNEYYLTIALFQVGYVLAEVPSNMILSVTRPSYYIPALMVLWGSVAAALGAVKNTKQLIGLRVLLGVFEAGFSV